jgi:hypothetical protein
MVFRNSAIRAQVSDVISDQFTAAADPSATLIDPRQQLAVGNGALARALLTGNRRAIMGQVSGRFRHLSGLFCRP